MFNQKGGFLPIIGVIILLLIGGIYYLNTRSKPVENQTASTSPPTEMVQPSPGTISIDETSKEQIFTSNMAKFSIQVPKDWQINDRHGVFVSIPGEVVFAPAGTEISHPYSQHIAITTSDVNEGGNIRFKFGTADEFKQKLAEPISNGEGQRLYKIKNLKVDGKDAMQYITRSLPGDQTDSYYGVITWTQNNGRNYYIEFNDKDLSIYNKIISTLKFIN